MPRDSSVTKDALRPGTWEMSLRGEDRQQEEDRMMELDVDADLAICRALMGSREGRHVQAPYRQHASTFTIRLVPESDQEILQNRQDCPRIASVRALSDRKLLYRERPAWTRHGKSSRRAKDSTSADGGGLQGHEEKEDSDHYNVEIEFVAHRVVSHGAAGLSRRRDFAEALEPAVHRFTHGEHASVLILHWDPSPVLAACQSIFENLDLIRALELEFNGECGPGLGGVTLSWVEICGVFGLRDALAEAASGGRQSRRPSSASADGRPRIADGGAAVLNALEVRLTDMLQALQLVERMAGASSHERPTHRVLTLKHGDARLQLVFADSREPLELQQFNTVLDALEAQRPVVPFHTSRIANILRGALLDKEALAVISSIGCVPSGSDLQAAESTATVADPDRAVALLSLVSRLQHFCGVLDADHDEQNCDENAMQPPSTEDLLAAVSATRGHGHDDDDDDDDAPADDVGAEGKLSEGGPATLGEQSLHVLALLEVQSELTQARGPHGQLLEAKRSAAWEAARWIKVAMRRLDDNAAALHSLQDTNEFLRAENNGLEEAIAQLRQDLADARSEISETREALRCAEAKIRANSEAEDAANVAAPAASADRASVSRPEIDAATAGQDFALYQHVMETTVLRIQGELNTAIQERTAALEACKKAEAKARKDHRAALEQSKYVKEVSERLTTLFHESQAQQRELESLRASHEAVAARHKRDRYELDAARKQRHQMQMERDALASKLETLGAELSAKTDRERQALQRRLEVTRTELAQVRDELERNRAPPPRPPRRMTATARSARPQDAAVDSSMNDIVCMLRERKAAMLASSTFAASGDDGGADNEEEASKRRAHLDRRAFTESLLAGLKARKLQRGRLAQSGVTFCQGHDGTPESEDAAGEKESVAHTLPHKRGSSNQSQASEATHVRIVSEDGSRAQMPPRRRKGSTASEAPQKSNARPLSVSDLRTAPVTKADLRAASRHRMPPFPHSKPPWKIAGA